MTKTLIISNHHRRSLWFDQTIERFKAAGLDNIALQNTGGGEFADFRGSVREVFSSGMIPYDTAMMNFKRRLVNEECDTILMIDNDCFITDIDMVRAYIRDFEEGGFDFACHFITRDADKYATLPPAVGSIHPVPRFDWDETDTPPRPIPHFENAFLLIKKSLWDALTLDDFSHGRKMMRAIERAGAKVGGHKAQYKGTHSHYGPGWFHVGALMGHYNLIEQGRLVFTEDEFNLPRLGYFAAMEEESGGYAPAGFQKQLKQLWRLIDRQKATDAWRDLITGTCMERK